MIYQKVFQLSVRTLWPLSAGEVELHSTTVSKERDAFVYVFGQPPESVTFFKQCACCPEVKCEVLKYRSFGGCSFGKEEFSAAPCVSVCHIELKHEENICCLLNIWSYLHINE